MMKQTRRQFIKASLSASLAAVVAAATGNSILVGGRGFGKTAALAEAAAPVAVAPKLKTMPEMVHMIFKSEPSALGGWEIVESDYEDMREADVVAIFPPVEPGNPIYTQSARVEKRKQYICARYRGTGCAGEFDVIEEVTG